MDELETILFQIYNKRTTLSMCGKDIKVGVFHPPKFQPLFLELYIERVEGKLDKLKVPYPFGVESHEDDGLIFLDYRISTFNKNTQSDFKSEDISNLIHHKYFDKILTIEIKEDE